MLNNFLSVLFYKFILKEDDINSIYTNRQNILSDLLIYCINNIPYYKKYFGENKFTGSLDDFPIIDKKTINDNGYALFKEKYKNNKYISRKTSGTTGVPSTVYIDKKTLSSQLLARNYFFNMHGINLGMKEARFWKRSMGGLSAKLKQKILNRVIVDDNTVNAMCNNGLFPFHGIDYFYGYPSLLLEVAKFFDGKQLRPQPKLVISTAEVLSEEHRKYLSNVFKCDVVQEYGCTEVDIIAFQCPNGNYHLNPRLIVEFEDLGYGDHGVIVTDLINRAMPIIRYRLNDYVRLNATPCGCCSLGSSLSFIGGRSSDRFVDLPNGLKVHSSIFSEIVSELVDSGKSIVRFKVDHVSPTNMTFYLSGITDPDQKNLIRKLLKKKMSDLFTSEICVEIIFGGFDTNIKSSYYVRSY